MGTYTERAAELKCPFSADNIGACEGYVLTNYGNIPGPGIFSRKGEDSDINSQ